MQPDDFIDFDGLPLAVRTSVDEICTAFESSWRSGQAPDLGAVLACVDDRSRTAAFHELLHLELEYRRKAGEAPTPDTYADRFPDLAQVVRDVFDRESVGPPADGARAVPATSPRTVGTFPVEEELGRGGMAVVYRARDRRLDRDVAVKVVLAGEHCGAAAAARFIAEAQVLARLEHPNIVRIYGCGLHDGRPYLALEYVPGGTLARRLAAGPLGPRVAAELIETLARAVHYAHGAGVVHRDLKPSNILLGHPDRLDHPKVSDFGLARAVGEGVGLTQSGQILGTPSYMAPEQACGKPVGPGADVYALGALLYECLTGRVPFRADTVLATIRLLLETDPPPPRRHRPDLPADLETVCLKCLAKSPADRYATAADLAADLRRWLDGLPVTARPAGRIERARKWVARNPWPAAAMTATAVGLLGVSVALGYALAGWGEADRQRRVADESLLRESREREAATAARDRAEETSYFAGVTRARLELLSNDTAAARATLAACAPARRGWEWHWLRSTLTADAWTAPAVAAPYVLAVAFSPDGRWVAVGGGGNPFFRYQGTATIRPGIVRLLDAATGRVVREFVGHGNVVTDVAFSPDGTRLASVGCDGTARVWATATGDELVTLPAADGLIALGGSVAFSPDGARLATLLATTRGTPGLAVWDLARREPFFRREVPDAERVEFLPTGELVLSRGAGAVSLCDPATGAQRRSIAAAGRRHVARPDAGVIVSCLGDTVRVYTATGDPVHVLSGPTAEVLDVAVSADGLLVAAVGADRAVRVWQTDTGVEVAVYRGHAGRVGRVCFHPDGHAIATGDQDPGDVKLWDLTRPPEFRVVPAVRRDVHALALPSADRLAWVTDNQYLAADAGTGEYLTANGAVDAAGTVTPARLGDATPDARLVAFAGRGRAAVRVWESAELARDLRSPSPLVTVPAGPGVHGVALAADGTRLVTAARDGDRRRVRVWDVPTGQPRAEFQPAAVGSRLHGAVAVSADGTLVAFDDSRPDGGRVRVCRADDGHETGAFPFPSPVVTALAFGPGGTVLAAAGEGGVARVWWLDGGEVVLNAPPGLAALAWSPDGRLLAGATRELVVLWDAATGRDIMTLRGAPARTADIAFNPHVAWSPDGRGLAALNHDKTISVWRADGNAAAHGVSARRREWYARLAAAGLAGQRAAAGPHLQRVLELGPPADGSRDPLATLFADAGRWDAAADLLAPVAATTGDLATLCHWASLCAWRGDDAGYQAACDAIRKCARDRPYSAPLAEGVQGLLLAPGQLGEPAPARAVLDAYLRADPNYFWARFNDGMFRLRTGDPAGAIRAFDGVLAMARSGRDHRPLAWAGLALAHRAAGNPVAASDALKELTTWHARVRRDDPQVAAGFCPKDWPGWKWLYLEILTREAARP